MSGPDFSVPVENFPRPDTSHEPDRQTGFLLPIPAFFPDNVTTSAYALSLLVFAGQGRLFGFQGYDANASGEFIQVYDLASIPTSATTPKVVLSTGTAAGNFSAYFGTAGRWFRRGCIIVASSTGPTYTAAASANMWVDAQYLQYD